VISRNGVMFFGDPVAAFANLARAMKPDGRMVLLVWQAMAENPWLAAFRAAVPGPLPPPDGPGPFALGDPDRVRTLLTAAGFAEPELRGVREPTYYGPDVAAAERYVSTMLAGQLAERFPNVAEMAMAVTHEGGLGGCDDDVEFEFVLDLLLEGLERRRALSLDRSGPREEHAEAAQRAP
jgi:SAM-dependent methyltransferase